MSYKTYCKVAQISKFTDKFTWLFVALKNSASESLVICPMERWGFKGKHANELVSFDRATKGQRDDG